MSSRRWPECLGERELLDDATEPLETCVRGCRAAPVAAKADCRASCSGDAACLDACVDAAQVAALTCRDDCREAFRANGGPAAIEQCREEFRTCVDACPPARSH
jgi:hypothetical protein